MTTTHGYLYDDQYLPSLPMFHQPMKTKQQEQQQLGTIYQQLLQVRPAIFTPTAEHFHTAQYSPLSDACSVPDIIRTNADCQCF